MTFGPESTLTERVETTTEENNAVLFIR